MARATAGAPSRIRRVSPPSTRRCARCSRTAARRSSSPSAQPRSLDAIYDVRPAARDRWTRARCCSGRASRSGVTSLRRARADLPAAGIPVVGEPEAPALAEGGDTLWLDESTLVVGRSATGRTTSDAAAIAVALPAVDVIAVDLPHLRGRGEVLHLLSLISPLDDDLAVVYLPLMPVRLVELLEERGVRSSTSPTRSSRRWAQRARARRRGSGSRSTATTRRAGGMEAAGVEVLVYSGDETLAQGRRRPDVPDAAARARLIARARPPPPASRRGRRLRSPSRARGSRPAGPAASRRRSRSASPSSPRPRSRHLRKRPPRSSARARAPWRRRGRPTRSRPSGSSRGECRSWCPQQPSRRAPPRPSPRRVRR